jgi:Icc-related predicted phosphoesterase
MAPKSKKVKIAALGDIHVKSTDENNYKDLFKEISVHSDILIICGDLTDTGLASEAEVLANELTTCTVPVVTVLGNHDYEQNQQEEIKTALRSQYTFVLDGESTIIKDIGFVGIKGFGGGFGSHMLSSWGEPQIKEFVKETVDESLRLESTLARLETKHKIVILHYSPIRDTIEGESEQIYPFLGCSRLVEPINRREATAVFHGHAHNGTLQGKTSTNIPVFNVARHLLFKNGYPKGYYIYEIEN